ncbi:MAG: phosphoglycerate dehydrogenase [Desulfobulbaceae bacterium]|uniref:D-3-phosphoglycerate dehydrogenase n=1 Tax=Candidatus Desulfatifera sulfidica TaxID=2841691 RepID=A0A8J6N824_9BACT|nr:phosphoglycerate dehydrogenase [Candidatus Desulfatifera sulfidica]
MSPAGAQILKDAGLDVDIKTGLAPEELKAIIGEYDGLVIRSATKVTSEIIDAAENLRVVGRAGIGLDNVDIPTASQKGIVVMNAPDGNATTAAEHAIAMMMSLSRNIPQATASMKEGKWEKKSFMGRELTGKTLGVFGIGRIGAIAASRAQGLRMKTIAYDPHMPKELVDKLGVELVDLMELARRSDYITVHVPLTKETNKVLSTEFFKNMKNDAMFIDCARGGVCDEDALYQALVDGEIAGAALDVFAKEPTTLENCPLLGLKNFICTPHLGASTTEAQENVALAIAEQVADYLNKGVVTNAVNVPSVSDDVLAQVGPYVTLGEMLGSLHMQIAKGGVQEVNIEYSGELADLNTSPVTVAFLKGLFTPILQDAVNYVNAPVIAKERGIRVVESKTDRSDDFTNVLSIKVVTSEGENVLVGTVFGKKEPRLVRLNTFRLEALPAGPMLLVYNKDIPGVIGALGTTLGKGGVNISRMTVGREEASNQNIILLNTDNLISKDLLDEVLALDHIDAAQALELAVQF